MIETPSYCIKKNTTTVMEARINMKIPNAGGQTGSLTMYGKMVLGTSQMSQSRAKSSDMATSPSQFGHTIRAYNGETRNKMIDEVSRSSNPFKTIGKVLLGIATLPITLPFAAGTASIGLIARLVSKAHYHLETKINNDYKINNEFTLDKLRTSYEGSQKSGTLAQNQQVLDRLVLHAKTAANPPLGAEEIRKYVETGEKLATLIVSGKTTGTGKSDDPLCFTINRQKHPITSSTYTTRALAWYIAAQAARQDIDNSKSRGFDRIDNLTKDSEYVMSDPGNRIYHFLNAAPNATARLSADPKENITQRDNALVNGLFAKPNLGQRGIDDFQNGFPGKGGAIIFDKHAPAGKPETLSIKFEQSGLPSVFSNDPGQTRIQKFTRFFAALDRQMTNAMRSFSGKDEDTSKPFFSVESSQSGKLVKNWSRSGMEADLINKFKALVDEAISQKIIAPDASAIMHSAEKFGFPYIENAANNIRKIAELEKNNRLDNAGLIKVKAQSFILSDLLYAISSLNGANNQSRLERRGGEVHVNLANSSLLEKR